VSGVITHDDIKRLVEANAEIRKQLNEGQARVAAGIACENLDWLTSQGSFWHGLRDWSGTLQDHFARVSSVMNNLTDFIDAECMIFKELGFDTERTEAVVGTVYAEIGVLRDIDPEDITVAGLTSLQKHVTEAAKSVCRQRKSPFMRGVDWVVSWKAARIFAGAAVAGANGLAIGTAWLAPHPLSHQAAAVSTASITIGGALMKWDAIGLLDLLKPKG
jgi:hypothetical protein